jgi:hypothetical protein
MKSVKNGKLQTLGSRIFTLSRVRAMTGLAMVMTMLALVTSATIASAAGNCLKDEYGKNVQCSANDVSVAFADNPRDLQGNPLTGPGKGCAAGQMFSFIADFHIVTTATARENIGLYFQTGGGSSALTGGTCSDNIISPLHDPGQNTTGSCGSGAGQVPCLGSALYHEYDTSLTGDNCGDTTSADGTNQIVTVEVDNALCKAGINGLLSLPNCTSWQQPGGALLCASSPPNKGWPWVPAAIPGSPSKCHCDGSFTVPIQVQTPGVSVTKSADKTSLDDPGGTVTYTVAVTNNKSNFGSVTLNQVCDSAYGTIAAVTGQTTCPAGIPGLDGTATPASCKLPATIALGSTFNCTFTANMTEQNSPVTDTATANGVGADGVTGFSAPSNSVTVTVNEAPTTATTTKSFVSTQAGCATVRYSVDIHNSSSADETLKLLASAAGTPPIIALNDSQYCDVTQKQGHVLGTTCGVAENSYGLGTMASGQPGALLSTAGTLPATIAAGADYTCQFDAQFCGAIGSVTKSSGTCNGIQQIDTITPALLDDEGNTFTNTSNQLTVSECFSPDVQSQ